MAGRGPQTFKKKQKEQQRKERRQEKLAKKLERKRQGPTETLPNEDDDNLGSPVAGDEQPMNGTAVGTE